MQELPPEIPTARMVMKNVPSVTVRDSVMKALQQLRDLGVVVLVDDHLVPQDILTSCDLDAVRERAQGLTKESPASALFEASGREVFRVKESDDLRAVAQMISRKGLATGITVVNEAGAYVGYLFNADLRQSAERLAKETKEAVEKVQAAYPEAWSSVGSRVGSSLK